MIPLTKGRQPVTWRAAWCGLFRILKPLRRLLGSFSFSFSFNSVCPFAVFLFFPLPLLWEMSAQLKPRSPSCRPAEMCVCVCVCDGVCQKKFYSLHRFRPHTCPWTLDYISYHAKAGLRRGYRLSLATVKLALKVPCWTNHWKTPPLLCQTLVTLHFSLFSSSSDTWLNIAAIKDWIWFYLEQKESQVIRATV